MLHLIRRSTPHGGARPVHKRSNLPHAINTQNWLRIPRISEGRSQRQYASPIACQIRQSRHIWTPSQRRLYQYRSEPFIDSIKATLSVSLTTCTCGIYDLFKSLSLMQSALGSYVMQIWSHTQPMGTGQTT